MFCEIVFVFIDLIVIILLVVDFLVILEVELEFGVVFFECLVISEVFELLS